MKSEEPIARDLLALLCCPVTRQPLALATTAVVEKLEQLRVTGALRNHGGHPIDEPIQAGLIRADGTLFFPLRAGIPMLLMDEAVSL